MKFIFSHSLDANYLGKTKLVYRKLKIEQGMKENNSAKNVNSSRRTFLPREKASSPGPISRHNICPGSGQCPLPMLSKNIPPN